MVLGLPYSEVAHVALEFYPDAKEAGLSCTNIQRIIKRLTGRKFESLLPSKANLEVETGLLFVHVPQSAHTVVLFQGIVYDPQTGVVWNLHAYLATRKAKPYRLLRP